MAGQIRVVHLSSSHNPDDARIFWKECISLAQAGYDVTFVVPSERDAKRNNVNLVAVKCPAGRFGRILRTPIAVVIAGLRRKADVFHFHDPELIPGALFLRTLGKRVIYDAHEDLPRDVLYKGWIPLLLRRPVALGAAALEWFAGRVLSGVVAATPVIAQRFPRRRTVLVQNFASLKEFISEAGEARAASRAVAYVGGITAERCAFEIVEAIGRVSRFPNASLIIAGYSHPATITERLATLPGWSRVDYRGNLDRSGVRRVLGKARAGLVLFHPLQAYIQSQPVKLFEYMAAGLPVIAANFPWFREIVEGNRCGLCVPPCDVEAIAKAIEWVFDHEAEAAEMGQRGRELVLSRFNWEREEQELLRFYETIVPPP